MRAGNEGGGLMLAVRWSHNQFVEQHLSESAMKEQSQLISLLLRDLVYR